MISFSKVFVWASKTIENKQKSMDFCAGASNDKTAVFIARVNERKEEKGKKQAKRNQSADYFVNIRDGSTKNPTVIKWRHSTNWLVNAFRYHKSHNSNVTKLLLVCDCNCNRRRHNANANNIFVVLTLPSMFDWNRKISKPCHNTQQQRNEKRCAVRCEVERFACAFYAICVIVIVCSFGRRAILGLACWYYLF